MAQLLLISEKSITGNDNRQVDDIVGVFDDVHQFSDREKEVFTILKVPETTSLVLSQLPKTLFVFKANTMKWTTEAPEEKEAWRDAAGNICDIVVKPAFKARWEDNTVKENFSRYPENSTILIQA